MKLSKKAREELIANKRKSKSIKKNWKLRKQTEKEKYEKETERR